MKDRYSTTAMRAVNLLSKSLSENNTSGKILIVMSSNHPAERCFGEILEILQPYTEHIPLIISYPTRTLRFGGRVLTVVLESCLCAPAKGVELQNYWLDEATELTHEQIGLLKSRVRK